MNYLKDKENDFVESFNFKALILFIVDAVVISLSFFVALLIKHDMSLSIEMFKIYFGELLIVTLIYWIAFESIRMFKSLWGFVDIWIIVGLLGANIFAATVTYFLFRGINGYNFALGLYITALLITTFMTIISRLVYKVIKTIKTAKNYY